MSEIKPSYVYAAIIQSVYDGDTFTAMIDTGFHIMTMQKLRLSRVDTPEVREVEKIKGLEVRDVARKLIEKKKVLIKTEQDRKGKYGRYLADVLLDDWTWLSEFLVKSGHAKYVDY